MKPRLLFVHGWALDRTLWDAVLAELGAETRGAAVTDAGYYGRPVRAEPLGGGPVLGVGQSLGALELLTAPPTPLAGLVAIDGFARFSAAPDFPEGQHIASLKLMARRLRTSPSLLVSDFLAEALRGAAAPSGLPDREALARGLDRLLALDGRAQARRLPIWRLHATEDPVASLKLADASFAGADVRARRLREADDHLSPLSAPQACADLIRDALEALSP